MKSIKYKLLTGIILINSIMLIGIGLFIFNFRDVYIKYTSKDLNEFGNEVKHYLNEGIGDDVDNQISRLSENKNINLDIYNNEGSLIYSNKLSQGKVGHMRNMCSITNEYYINKDLTSYVMVEKSDNLEFLTTITNTDDGLYTIISKTPISAIENTIKITSNFLFLIFIPIIIISTLMAIWFSNRFTKPIRKLTKITDKIANLDFDEKVEIKTNDEIEKLGKSINILSDKVKSTLKNLQEKNEELETLINNKIKQEKIRREFVSSVSHELKTPITVISGYAQGLKSGVVESEEDIEYYIDVIYKESENMGILVKDLLDLYKLESNTFSIKLERVNIKYLILEIINNFNIRFEDLKINLFLELDDIYVLLDRVRIGQVLNNFIDNALYHIDDKKEIKINTKIYKKKIRVGVFNSGYGIDDEDFEKIWYSFVRIDKTRTYSDNRVGLGLSVVKEIINLHSGDYGVLNKEGGVEFYFELNL
ncbi:HAMP domain-containing sensor histidine kinase [Paraclostridium sordellii]|uniref:HAMP domain-containing sensor histidine kinase n=2 Tax=Paraclostridium sordellii TaxID=1505 RepID=UPI0005DFFB32|nr:HAMP domain-containing sensor histidine kinase [Paeniclostridium sordellii]CEQ18008.1 membrane associated histidine kinase with hamp domain [[Clostridium] sordellii] [Paeniclostridium sordellii]